MRTSMKFRKLCLQQNKLWKHSKHFEIFFKNQGNGNEKLENINHLDNAIFQCPKL